MRIKKGEFVDVTFDPKHPSEDFVEISCGDISIWIRNSFAAYLGHRSSDRLTEACCLAAAKIADEITDIEGALYGSPRRSK